MGYVFKLQGKTRYGLEKQKPRKRRPLRNPPPASIARIQTLAPKLNYEHVVKHLEDQFSKSEISNKADFIILAPLLV